MSSFNPRPGPQRAWMLLVEVWLLLAELYLTLDQTTDMQQCIQEATQIFPPSHHIMHMVSLNPHNYGEFKYSVRIAILEFIRIEKWLINLHVPFRVFFDIDMVSLLTFQKHAPMGDVK